MTSSVCVGNGWGRMISNVREVLWCGWGVPQPVLVVETFDNANFRLKIINKAGKAGELKEASSQSDSSGWDGDWRFDVRDICNAYGDASDT